MPESYEPLDFEPSPYSEKNYAIAVCFSAIFGILGIHHFYLERWLHGLFDLSMSIGGFTLIMMDRPILGIGLLAIDGIHTIYVTYKLLVGEYKDGEGKLVTYPGQKLK